MQMQGNGKSSILMVCVLVWIFSAQTTFDEMNPASDGNFNLFSALKGLITLIIIIVIILIVISVVARIFVKRAHFGKVILGITLIIIGAFLLLNFWSIVPAPDHTAVEAKDVEDDYDGRYFKSYDKDDVITIRDRISKIEIKTISIEDEGNLTYTIIYFESSSERFNVTFKGNLKEEYNRGDLVVVFVECETLQVNNETIEYIKSLRYWKDSKYELGAEDYQIWHSWYVDIWFYITLVIGAVYLIYGTVLILKKKEEKEEKTEEEGSENIEDSNRE